MYYLKSEETISYDSELKEAFDTVAKHAKFPVEKQKLTADLKREIEKNLFSRKFENFSRLQSNRMKTALITAFREGTTIGELIKIFKGIVPRMTDLEAERIVRTEQTSIQNTAREHGYKTTDPRGENFYIWSGPTDRRNSDACKAIKERVGDGVKMDELKEIVREESSNMMGAKWELRDFVPHPMCRHRLQLNPYKGR